MLNDRKIDRHGPECPPGEHGKYLICSVLCGIGAVFGLGCPDAGVSAGRCVFPPAGAGGRPDPPAFGSSCGRKEKAVGRAVRFEGFRSVADLVRLRTVPGRHGRRSVRQADRRRPIRRERTKRLCRDTAIWGDVWTGSLRYRLFARRLWIQPKERAPWNMRSYIERRPFRTWPSAWRHIDG